MTLCVHLVANPHYGFFRDELYFIVCGRHPALGYVDQPPLAPLLAAWSQSFGTSLFALRAVPAVCAAGAVYAACLFAAELGGGPFALALTGLVAFAAPEMMAFGERLSPDMIEVWTWPLIALAVLRIVKGGSPRLWLWAGVLTAIAAWSKYSVALFDLSLLAALLLTRERWVLRSWWFAAGALLAVVAILPNAWWQWANGFPMLTLLQNDYGKFLLKHPPFPIQQIMIMSPLLSLVWLIGLYALLRAAQTRFLGLTYLILIAVMWAMDAKNYYPAPIYPYLVAAGGVAIAGWARRRAVRTAIVAAVVAFALPSTPFVLPVLPIRTFVAYQEALGRLFGISFHVDRNAGNDIPIQYYADMTGWPHMAEVVASAYAALPAAERARAAIFAHNFGEASAIDVFGPRLGLPPALSGNNTFWIWGPLGYSGDVLIDVNGDAAADRGRFRSVRRVSVIHNPLAMPYENNVPVYLCRGIREPLAALWPKLKNYSYGFNGL